MSINLSSRKIARFVVRNRFFFIAFPILISFLMLYFSKDLKVLSRSNEFIPQRHPYIKIQKRLNDIFGGLNHVNILVKVEKGTILSPQIIEAIENISQDIELLSEVNPRRVISITSRKIKTIKIEKDGFFVRKLIRDIPSSDKELSSLKREIERNPLVYGPLVSKDFSATLIQADFKENIPSKVIFKKVNEILKNYRIKNVRFYVSGRPILEGWLDLYLKKILFLFFVAITFILFLLYLAFGRKRGVILPFVCGSMSAIISLGMVSILHFELDPITTLIPFLIAILSISHSIQFLERYFSEIEESDKEKVAQNILRNLLKPVRASLFTDFLGFGSLYLVDIKMMKTIAILGSVGVFSIFFTTVTFIPAVLATLPVPKGENKKRLRDTKSISFIMDLLCQLSLSKKASKTFFLIFFLFLIISLYGVFKIKVGEIEPGTSLLYKDSPYNIAEREINSLFCGSNPYYVLVAGKREGACKTSSVLSKMDELSSYLKRKVPEIGYSFSIADYIKLLNYAVFSGDMRHFSIPKNDRTIAEYLFLYESSSFPGDFSPFVDPTYTYANIKFDVKDCKGDTIRKIIKETGNWVRKNIGSDFLADFVYPGGLIGVLGATDEVIKDGLFLNIAILSILVFLRISGALKSFVGGAILFLPLAFSIILTFGAFGILHIPFTVETLPVASMGMGLGIDYSIYVASRIKEEAKRKRNLKAGIEEAIRTQGKAIFFTGLLLSLGIFSWVFSSIKLQAKLGFVLATLLLVNMFLALTLLPCIINISRPKFLEKEDRS